MRKLLPLFLILSACAAPQQPATQPDAALAGQKLFRQHCEGCHGAEAIGTHRAPGLRTTGMNEDALFRFVTNGDLRRGMPSWSRLPDERRWQIVAYIKTLPQKR